MRLNSLIKLIYIIVTKIKIREILFLFKFVLFYKKNVRVKKTNSILYLK